MYGVYSIFVTEKNEEAVLDAISENKELIKSVERSKWHKEPWLSVKLRYYIVCCTDEVLCKLNDITV